MRPVFHYDENAVPRFSGHLRGLILEYDPSRDGATEMVPLGYIPDVEQTFSYFEAASGICNEKGVTIAECTCSAIFGAEPLPGSKPLLGYMELTRLALERCCTAREAVDLMGALAEEYGFYGNTIANTGCAESLVVADKEEAWIFHVLADDTKTSAIWAAARVPDGHAAAVTNMFVIREVALDNPDRFRYSKSMLHAAVRNNLWAPGNTLLDVLLPYFTTCIYPCAMPPTPTHTYPHTPTHPHTHIPTHTPTHTHPQTHVHTTHTHTQQDSRLTSPRSILTARPGTNTTVGGDSGGHSPSSNLPCTSLQTTRT